MTCNVSLMHVLWTERFWDDPTSLTHKLIRGDFHYIWTSHPSQGWTQRGCLRGGTSSQRLEPSGASRERWESMRGAVMEAHWRGVRKFLKIYVSENAFQAILKPSFPYSITSILSKVRHSNPRGRGVLWYFHTHVGSGYFFLGGGQNFEFRYFLGFSEKWYSFGYEVFVDILGGSSQNWAIFSGHFYAF